MKDKMIRVSESLLNDLKLVKKYTGNVSYSEIIKELVNKELMKSMAYTSAGYLPEGTVVRNMENMILVIESVSDGKVVFNDNTYILNGGSACMSLIKISDTLAEYEGGAVSC